MSAYYYSVKLIIRFGEDDRVLVVEMLINHMGDC